MTSPHAPFTDPRCPDCRRAILVRWWVIAAAQGLKHYAGPPLGAQRRYFSCGERPLEPVEARQCEYEQAETRLRVSFEACAGVKAGE